MSLGYKIDRLLTDAAHESGYLIHPDSVIDTKGGEHLRGKDKERRHDEIRDRVNGVCEKCKKDCWWSGEWNHIKGGIGKVDNLENGEWLCVPCHRGGPDSVHPGPQMGRIK